MISRTPKNALIIFDPTFHKSARGVVKETLQYLEYHDNFYMLPVPLDTTDKKFSIENLMTLLEENGLPIEVIKNTECYLIVKNEALCEKSPEAQQKKYTDDVLKLTKKFKKPNVLFTYDYYLGHEKLKDPKVYQDVRKHYKVDTDNGFPHTVSTQVGLVGAADSMNKSPLKKGIVGEKFFGINRTYHNPPFKYLSTHGMGSKFKPPAEFDAKAKEDYQKEIKKEIASRQQNIEPILQKAEQEYGNPQSVAEKLGNLFDAYAKSENLEGKYPHQDKAQEIARKLYAYADNPPEDDPWGVDCVFIIKEESNSLPFIDARDNFSGLRLEVFKMMQNGSLLQVGVALKEHWQNKYKELERLKNSLLGEEKKCVENILNELRWLERSGKPYAALLKAVESTINILNNPSDDNLHKHYLIAQNFTQKPWARVLSGAMLCLLGVCIGIGIALTLYFTGGAALLAAPLITKLAMVSASLVTAGTAIIAGSIPSSLPLAIGSILLFKPPLQVHLKKLGAIQEQAKTKAAETKLEM